MELEPGTVVAQRYRIQRQLGRGGMGEVFAAENIRTGRVVAVKVLRSDSKQKSSAVERFRREARAAGAISSDYVTQVLDVEDDADHGIVLVFELLEGESLIERLKRTGPMTFDELFPIVEQVWMGLADAHKSGVIHRDLKPSNVFLERRNDGTIRVKILDFGISKIPREVGGETLTEMGQSLGTFSFMPPEQIGKAKTVDHRADIYAAATLIYQAMSGQLPYGAKNILQMVDLKTKSEPRALSTVLDGQVDPRLEAFLAKGLMRDPANRFQSAHEALEVWRGLKQPGGARQQQAPTARSEAPTAQPRSSQTIAATPQAHLANQAAGRQQQAQQGSAAPRYEGSAAQIAPVAPLAQNQPGRAPATVMLVDPHSHGGNPLPQGQGFSPQSSTSPLRSTGKLGGTVAMAQQDYQPVAYAGAAAPGGVHQGGKGPPINVPVVNDTTSEGGNDQVATIAMPVRNVAAAVQAAQQQAAQQQNSLPRVHDDQAERGQMGTQLMSHASLRQAGAQIPTSAHRSSSSIPRVQPSQPGLPQSGPSSFGQAGQSDRSSHSGATAMSQSSPNMQALSQSGSQSGMQAALSGQQQQQEGQDQTTVYRREKHQPPTANEPTSGGGGSRLGIILGIVAFALVGFAIAAVALSYYQTGKFLWE